MIFFSAAGVKEKSFFSFFLQQSAPPGLEQLSYSFSLNSDRWGGQLAWSRYFPFFFFLSSVLRTAFFLFRAR